MAMQNLRANLGTVGRTIVGLGVLLVLGAALPSGARGASNTCNTFIAIALDTPFNFMNVNDRPHVTGLGGTPAGMLMGGEGVKIRSLVALPPAGTLLVHVTPAQVVVMLLSPSYSKIAPWSVHGRAEGPAQSSS